MIEHMADPEREMDRLRDENARLVMAEAEAMALVLNHEGAIARLTRERDEARATKDMHKERQEEAWAEVARLEEQAVLIETLEKRIKGLHVANDSFGDLARRVEEFQEHERQTHERLGAILGTDDSLEACAKRLRQRVEELEREAGILTQGITDQHDRAEAAEAENVRLRGYMRPDQIEEAETVAKLIRERDEARAKLFEAQTDRMKYKAEVARLRSVPDGLYRPDADHLRGLEGDQTEVDRYWMGWTDALDQVSAELAPEVK